MPATSQSRFHQLFIALPTSIFLVLSISVYADFSSDNTYKKKDSKDLSVVERLIYKESYSNAIVKLEQILESDDQNADAWNLYGYASRKSGDNETAEAAYEIALSINPNHLGALEYQGELFITLGRMENANANLKLLSTLCENGCDELDALSAAIEASE